jgi:isochorismate synthase
MQKTLSQLHQILLNKGIAFVRYSLPGDIKAITLISYDPVSFEDLDSLADNQDSGFLFTPFVISDEHPIWFLKADEIVDDSKDFQSILKELKALPDAEKKVVSLLEPTSKMNYSKVFDVFMSQLKSATLDKAILSKIVSKPKTNETLVSIFSRLSKAYPSAFTYLISLPSGETWMGATPELLLKQDQSGFQTMALAGTQVLGSREPNEVVWEEKEIEEQAYVSNYVQNVLTSISESLEVSDTYSAKAGNLVHLRTDFLLKQVFDRKKTFVIAEKLHPTPAVCGIPLEKSRALILNTERHNRAYYTGFLGPINANSISLFVNLRCMQVLPEKYALYVGGGITRDSEMEKEWAETEAKAQTLLSVIDVAL